MLFGHCFSIVWTYIWCYICDGLNGIRKVGHPNLMYWMHDAYETDRFQIVFDRWEHCFTRIETFDFWVCCVCESVAVATGEVMWTSSCILGIFVSDQSVIARHVSMLFHKMWLCDREGTSSGWHLLHGIESWDLSLIDAMWLLINLVYDILVSSASIVKGLNLPE